MYLKALRSDLEKDGGKFLWPSQNILTLQNGKTLLVLSTQYFTCCCSKKYILPYTPKQSLAFEEEITRSKFLYEL